MQKQMPSHYSSLATIHQPSISKERKGQNRKEKREREREKRIYKRVRLMRVTHYHTLTIHFEKVFIEN